MSSITWFVISHSWVWHDFYITPTFLENWHFERKTLVVQNFFDSVYIPFWAIKIYLQPFLRIRNNVSYIGTEIEISLRSQCLLLSSSHWRKSSVLSPQCTYMILNKIEKTFNKTFTGLKNFLQRFQICFSQNPSCKGMESTS